MAFSCVHFVFFQVHVPKAFNYSKLDMMSWVLSIFFVRLTKTDAYFKCCMKIGFKLMETGASLRSTSTPWRSLQAENVESGCI